MENLSFFTFIYLDFLKGEIRMFGLSSTMTFMLFVFWPLSLVAATLWGIFAFKDEEEDDHL